MFTVRWPSLPSLGLFSSTPTQAIDLPPVHVHETETAEDKPARALKHLLKLNHVENSLFDRRNFPNQLIHLLSSSFLQGADADTLGCLYEHEVSGLVKWKDSPAEITTLDWRGHLGRRGFDRAFVDFFEDEVVHRSYDWKEVVAEYLYTGKEPMFDSIMASLGLPLIHLAYAFEMDSREIAMEALGLAATCHNDIYKSLEDPKLSKNEVQYESKSLFEIFDMVRKDKDLDGLFSTPGDDNLNILFVSHNAVLLKHWKAWKIDNPIEQFRESQELAAALLVGTADSAGNYDWFFAMNLATSHAVRVMLPFIPPQFQISLLRQWWLICVGIYVAQLRPEIKMDQIRNYDLNGKDWKWVAEKAVKGEFSSDVYFVKTTRALKELASTWGDSDSFFLKAAVRFVTEFKCWGGNFVGYDL
ncbi:uncharacterized protein N7518_003290 [Penicillium psychrosexuale]|uniref:uncharacterized protein n=1 Tax=Penicillium psychrosexuale TaxID=1002107 RepID=UPI002544DB2B|nr:uncharacterized protein N7518_003290 [Penicillium psychrosexuale]KAJ5801222.1 hypothetical protein N7518_003290 [Penicillium psychrosexuale]